MFFGVLFFGSACDCSDNVIVQSAILKVFQRVKAHVAQVTDVSKVRWIIASIRTRCQMLIVVTRVCCNLCYCFILYWYLYLVAGASSHASKT